MKEIYGQNWNISRKYKNQESKNQAKCCFINGCSDHEERAAMLAVIKTK